MCYLLINLQDIYSDPDVPEDMGFAAIPLTKETIQAIRFRMQRIHEIRQADPALSGMTYLTQGQPHDQYPIRFFWYQNDRIGMDSELEAEIQTYVPILASQVELDQVLPELEFHPYQSSIKVIDSLLYLDLYTAYPRDHAHHLISNDIRIEDVRES